MMWLLLKNRPFVFMQLNIAGSDHWAKKQIKYYSNIDEFHKVLLFFFKNESRSWLNIYK